MGYFRLAEGVIHTVTAPKVPWQTVMFSGAVHSFADPTAQGPMQVYISGAVLEPGTLLESRVRVAAGARVRGRVPAGGMVM